MYCGLSLQLGFQTLEVPNVRFSSVVLREMLGAVGFEVVLK